MEGKTLQIFLPFIALAVSLPFVIVTRQFLGLFVYGGSWQIAGSLFLFAGVFVAAVNIYTSFIRDRIHLFRQGDMDSFQFVSGIPAIGSICIIISSLCLTQSTPFGIALLATTVADTGGFPWFLIAVFIDWYSGTED